MAQMAQIKNKALYPATEISCDRANDIVRGTDRRSDRPADRGVACTGLKTRDVKVMVPSHVAMKRNLMMTKTGDMFETKLRI